MIGKATKKLIIVCDEETEPYANYLRQLISTNDDKDGEVVGIEDGTVEAAVWLEKEYLANKAQISSNEHILFIGDNKTSKSESSSMIVKYDKYGMKYGWLGKRAMMKVDNVMLAPEVYDEFITYCLGYQTEFEKIAMRKPVLKTLLAKKDKANEVVPVEEEVVSVEATEDEPEKEKKKLDLGAVREAGKVAAVGLGAAVAGLPGAITEFTAVSIGNGIEKAQTHKKVKDQQYRALSVILYIDGLQEFLEG